LGQALSDQQSEIAAGEAAAVEQLLNAFANGGATLAVPPRSVIDPSAVATATASLPVATAARERLQEEVKALPTWRSNARHGTARIALEVLTDEALERAHAVLNAEADLHQQKADLANLVRLITSEGKRLHRNPPQIPGIFARAGAYTVSDREVMTDWRAEYDRLCRGEDPEPNPLPPAA